MHMSFSVAVAGASGYAAGEVLRLLLAHPGAEIGALTAASSVGTKLGEHHPHLPSLADRVITATTAEHLMGHDVVVLGLPHGKSGEIAAQLDPEVLVLDLGADHRLTSSEAWAEYYGGTFAGTWTYGMPELLHAGEQQAAAQRALLRKTRRIAVPGCNVTAVTLGLQPGIAAGLLSGTDLVAVLANGYSGAGRSLKPHLLAAEAFESASPYQVGGIHRHIPEIVQNMRVAGADEVTISFTPTLVPMSRGILATATARYTGDAQTLRAAYEAAYGDERFITLLPEGSWPTTGSVVGANTARIGIAVDHKACRAVTVTAIDNLVKGTAGAAIQSLNLALGLPEHTGLTTEGVSP
jgi:N-acetyl-gamma-glutamyl-phosphate reductase